MSGICALFQKEKRVESLKHDINIMLDALIHRGDRRTNWVSPEGYLALGVCEFLMSDSLQGQNCFMTSSTGRYGIAFDGIIYNYKMLRENMLSAGTDVHAETELEVLLAMIEAYGLKQTLEKLEGMFNFVLVDIQNELLYIACDRLGEKQIYYGFNNGIFICASELKSFRSFPLFHADICSKAIYSFLQWRVLQKPLSIYENIFQLLPGSFYTLDMRSGQGNIEFYYSMRDVVLHAQEHPFKGSLEDAVDVMHFLLRESIHMQLDRNISLGCFLSGGIDSSLVASIAKEVSGKKLKTFSLGYHKSAFDESQYAKKIAEHLQTEHSECYLDCKEIANTIHDIVKIHDEPFANTAKFSAYYLYRFAGKITKACLSGDGGDELFAGYPRTFYAMETWDHQCKNYECIEDYYYFEYLNKRSKTLLKDNMPVEYDSCKDIDNLLKRLLYFDIQNNFDMTFKKIEPLSQKCRLDIYKPFCNHKLMQFSWILPNKYKLNDGRGKIVERKLLARYVPSRLVERPKQGFSFPYITLMNEYLGDLCDYVFSKKALSINPYINAKEVQKQYQIFKQTGKGNPNLWTILILQLWIDAHQAN